MSREGKGEFNNLYRQFKEDEERFYTAFRMNLVCFDEMIRNGIRILNTIYTSIIEPIESHAVAFRKI
jgi:hypothetical protein